MEETPDESHWQRSVNHAHPGGGERRERSSPPESWRRHPAHIVRVGTDHIALHIDDVVSDADLAAIVERIDELLDAGWEQVDITPTSAARRYMPMMPGTRDHVQGADSPRPGTLVA